MSEDSYSVGETGSSAPPQRIEQRDQLTDRTHCDERRRGRLGNRSAVSIGPGAGNPDRRTILELDQQILVTTPQNLEDLALQGMVSACHGDPVRRAAAIVIRSVG